MEDCLFCKIIAKEIPCEKIYEDTDTLAFLDTNPHNKGHTLVIPKEHAVTLFDIDETSLQKVMHTVQKVAKALNQYSEGVNLVQNNNKAAGQLIDHFHFHVVPRASNDDIEDWPRPECSAKPLTPTPPQAACRPIQKWQYPLPLIHHPQLDVRLSQKFQKSLCP